MVSGRETFQMPVPRFPLATYRLQLNRHCTFTHASGALPYLADLGISDCYTSPYLQTRPGSLHGYDIVDPTTLNAEVGSVTDYHAFINALNVHQMGQILDIVPNHMHVAGPWNPWWQDVLEHGPSSRYARFFDINWTPVTRELQGRVLLPILGEPYDHALRNGTLTVCYQAGRFFIRYGEHRLPVDPVSSMPMLNRQLDTLCGSQDAESPHIHELRDLIAALAMVPGRNETDPERVTIRYRDTARIQRHLATLIDGNQTMQDSINDTLRAWNGTRRDQPSADRLDSLLRDQAYCLTFWRSAGATINYRRFFDVNDLAAIRVEDPDVFQHIHRYLFSLIQSAAVHGLRIDHVDGLYDPQRYLEHCQERACTTLGRPADSKGRSLFIIVEKILGKGEALPGNWPVHGTTGYDFLYLLNNLFVDARHQHAMDAVYREFAQPVPPFDTIACSCKTLFLETSMASELEALGYQMHRVSRQQYPSPDFTMNSLTHALKEIIACFPVYRTYISPREDADISDRDRAYLQLAVAQAKRRNPATTHRVFDWVQNILLKDRTAGETPSWEYICPFIMRFQQTTSPVMAKGIEDTALYRYNRLISLNEVGGDPSQFGIAVTTFHEQMRKRQQQWPFSLSATSTHDTKRSEDVRARINVLSELPQEWGTHVRRWHQLNRKKKIRVEGREAPSRNEEYFLYQTLLGAWPLSGLDSHTRRDFCLRIQEHMLKAIKEAKVHTSWINPDDAYEQAMSQFIRHILEPDPSNNFLEDFLPFQQTIARYGMYNALSQVALKIVCPGIPDFYQGSEIWNLTLVDPDNRRPVDFEHLHDLAKTTPSDDDITETVLQGLMESYEDGRIKFYITRTLLNYRKAHHELFQQGDYAPLATIGAKRHYLCAFQRTWAHQVVIVTVPRLIHGVIRDPKVPALGHNVWGNTGVVLRNSNPTTCYRHVLTNKRITARADKGGPTLAVAELFQQLPVAIMEQL
ncbi:MAG: malto-oligosyltrehalose synthase [Nitrospira sp.]|nr:malto-oligosyltrehalose synthase [Nitrospira sp.]